MSETRTMLFVTDEHGNIVAAAHKGEGSVPGLTVAVTPRPGQTIHEVEVPETVTRLTGRDFHFFVSQARFETAAAKLRFPELGIRHLHDED
jgi:hypothetical protein